MIDLGPFSLQGKVILVTGASSGLGRGTAQVISKLGAKVILAARNENELKKTLDSLVGDGHRMCLLDVSSSESRISLVDQIEELNGVVHCAGIAKLSPFRMISEKHIREIMTTNFEGPVHLTQRLLYKKKILPSSSIIVITSTAGIVGLEASAIYTASKAALNIAFNSLGIELLKQRIRVNSIAPGYIQTNMLSTMTVAIDDARIDALAPLGHGKPEDVGHTAAFLLSDASKWITKTVFRVDGGILSNTVAI